MEHQGRTSRASSTSSLGREVRCACQFFQSDSLLPERRAMIGSRPSSRNTNPPVACETRMHSDDLGREHEYEPIGTPLVKPRTMTPIGPSAPVVRIIDTDVAPVADSDDSIDLDARFTPGPVLEGNDLVLPLDGRIEDSAMEARELAGGGDTSEELESPQQLQDRLEERFLNAATPCTESRTDGEINTSQVDSSAMEELPLRRGARGLPDRLRSQAGKLRTRIKSIHRPSFNLSIDRLRSDKSRSPKSRATSERAKNERQSATSERTISTESSKVTGRGTEKRTRMERLRSSLTIERPRLSLPDRSRFHLPERPRLNIKKPNVRLPAMMRTKRSEGSSDTTGGASKGRSDESAASNARRKYFDFSTYPRIFDKRSKRKGDYATSSPKESRAESIESATLPRSGRKVAPSNWSLKFTDIKYADDEDDTENATLAERVKPWRRPSLEAPRLSLRPQESIEESLTWEESRRPDFSCKEEEDVKSSLSKSTRDVSYEDDESPRLDPRLYGDRVTTPEDPDSQDHEDEAHGDAYRADFEAFDPRDLKRVKLHDDLEPVAADEYEIASSAMDEDTRSDREQQQSSGSSYDRRRRGLIGDPDLDDEYPDSEEARLPLYRLDETSNVPKVTDENILAREILAISPKPPRRPERKRSMRMREKSIESYEIAAPGHPSAHQRTQDYEDYEDDNEEESVSESRHRVVYRAESAPQEVLEPLDDIVIVKPQRRKSRGSLRRSESLASEEKPRAPPRRRKRHRVAATRVNGITCNGHHSPEPEEIVLRPAPRKPQRDMNVISRDKHVEQAPPVPPKRSSRSRGASVVPDDDRTSHGAESIPEIGYSQEEIPRDDETESRLDYPGYAVIEKREKPPRPPPPRKRRDEKFATCPRPVKNAPGRPQRAYSTLKHPRPGTPAETFDLEPEEAYEELDDSDEEKRPQPNVSKIQERPLPPPPRPPRSRRERPIGDHDERETSPGAAMSEAFASTQTDPLPDDLVIEEEVTRAKLVVTPSRSGSQILVSMERVPSPPGFEHPRSLSQEMTHRAPRPVSKDYTGTPPERTTSQRTLDRTRRTPSPVRRSTAPDVPPLPSSKSIYGNERVEDYDLVVRSPSTDREYDDDREKDLQERLRETVHERLRLQEELERARDLRDSLISSETLRIGSLEVTDLRVDRLNVNNLEAQKLTASEIEALVVTATEITSKAENKMADFQPNLMRELMAIRCQLELVNQESVERHEIDRKREGGQIVQEHLQLDQVSPAMETRAIYSSIGASRESSPILTPGDKLRKIESRPGSPEIRSRSSSPSRTGSPVSGRQTASPVKSLPPVISVTPDTPEPVRDRVVSPESRMPQRAVLSYVQEEDSSLPIRVTGETRYVAFPSSQIPQEFFRLASTPSAEPRIETNAEPGVLELGQQLARALRIASRRAMRHFVGYIVNRIGHEETDTKTREVELALCALLLIIAGLLIVCFGGPRTITHHHHWDYFNPPRL